MIKNKPEEKSIKSFLKGFGYAIVLPVVIIIVWQIVAEAGIVNVALLPPPSKLWSVFVEDLLSGKIWLNLSASFVRVIVGYVIGVLLGLVIGFIMGLVVPVNKILSSITSLFRSIPVIALVPLFILLFGIGENSKYTVVAYASFWAMLLNTLGGIQNVDNKFLEVAYTYGISKSKTIFKIILPSALPSILTGARLSLSSAWMSIIAAEMFAASKGIGYLITTAKDSAQIAPMYVYVLVIGIIGLILDKVLIRIQNFYVKKTRGIEG